MCQLVQDLMLYCFTEISYTVCGKAEYNGDSLDLPSNLLYIGQAAPAPPIVWTTFVPVLLMGVILYFFVIRPQREKEKHRLDMLTGLRKNDRVITAGGLHGVVTMIKEKEVVLVVDEAKDVKVKVDKDAIVSVEHKEKHKEEQKAES